jgi:hypothetical protein
MLTYSEPGYAIYTNSHIWYLYVFISNSVSGFGPHVFLFVSVRRIVTTREIEDIISGVGAVWSGGLNQHKLRHKFCL